MKESAPGGKPPEEIKEEKTVNSSRRGFLKTVAAGAAAATVGFGGSIAERKINKIIESGSKQEVPVDQATIWAQEQDQVWIKALQEGDQVVLSSLKNFMEIYSVEAKILADRIADVQKKLSDQHWGNGVRSLAYRQLGFMQDRLNWLQNEVAVYSGHIKNYLDSPKPNNQMKEGNPNSGKKGPMS